MQVSRTDSRVDDMMRFLGSGHAPAPQSSIIQPPGPVVASAPTLLFIDERYAQDYFNRQFIPQQSSLLERVESEQARAIAAMHFGTQMHGGKSLMLTDPYGLALLKNRTIEIRDVVNPRMATDVRTKAKLIVAMMKKHEEKIDDPKVIFTINSPGGCITSMYSIMDTMDMLKNRKINGRNIKVVTVMDGYAASAASVIIANGTIGERQMSPRAQIMVHQPSSWTHGPVTDMVITRDQTLMHKENIMRFYLDRTRVKEVQSESWLREKFERDFWFETEEGLRLGFVDKPYDAFRDDELQDLDIDNILGTLGSSESNGCCS